jgi:hypothetical protein
MPVDAGRSRLGDVSRCRPPRPRRRDLVARSPTGALAALLALLAVGGAAAETPPHELKIAFIGDQGNGAGALAVLELIASEAADAVVHSGDFDYADDPAGWEALIDSVLGADFPYFASIGNHDESRFYRVDGYQQRMQARMDRLGIPWNGDLGVHSEFTWQGIHFVMTAPGVVSGGDGLYDLYIRDRFAASEEPWRISSWHKLQHLMQVGGKSDETGWGVYEESRRAGAIIATAHEHSYSRTHLLASMRQQLVANASDTLVLRADDPLTPADEGRSFAFVSGLGGQSIRNQEVFGDWFASAYTSNQGADYGALFGVFHVRGDPRLADFYFKDIDGNVVDAFTVRSTAGCGDADGDAICDEADDCLFAANPSQLDSDRDGYGNACDPDYNNDGWVGSADLVALAAGLGSGWADPAYRAVLDSDGDRAVGEPEADLLAQHFGGGPGPSGIACAGSVPCTACDGPDLDGDGVCDALDDCVARPNPGQRDADLDGYGNACDPDYTNDGVIGTPDFLVLRQSFGCRVGDPGCSPATDTNDDGVVGTPEFVLVRQGLGSSPGPSGVSCAGAPPCLGP